MYRKWNSEGVNLTLNYVDNETLDFVLFCLITTWVKVLRITPKFSIFQDDFLWEISLKNTEF